MDKKPVTKKDWNSFRSAGLLFFINSILHAFGWAIVVETDEAGDVVGAFPARVTFRGFTEDVQTEEHIKIAEYLSETASEFVDEAKS